METKEIIIEFFINDHARDGIEYNLGLAKTAIILLDYPKISRIVLIQKINDFDIFYRTEKIEGDRYIFTNAENNKNYFVILNIHPFIKYCYRLSDNNPRSCSNFLNFLHKISKKQCELNRKEYIEIEETIDSLKDFSFTKQLKNTEQTLANLKHNNSNNIPSDFFEIHYDTVSFPTTCYALYHSNNSIKNFNDEMKNNIFSFLEYSYIDIWKQGRRFGFLFTENIMYQIILELYNRQEELNNYVNSTCLAYRNQLIEKIALKYKSTNS